MRTTEGCRKVYARVTQPTLSGRRSGAAARPTPGYRRTSDPCRTPRPSPSAWCDRLGATRRRPAPSPVPRDIRAPAALAAHRSPRRQCRRLARTRDSHCGATGGPSPGRRRAPSESAIHSSVQGDDAPSDVTGDFAAQFALAGQRRRGLVACAPRPEPTAPVTATAIDIVNAGRRRRGEPALTSLAE